MGRPPIQLPRVTFRFPEELRTRLEVAAAANSRSVNAEVVARLEDSFRELPDYVALLAKAEENDRRLAALEELFAKSGSPIGKR